MDGSLAADLAELLLAAAPDAILLVDSEGRIRRANDAAGEMFACTRDDLVEELVDSLVPAAQRDAHEALRQQYTAAPERRPMGTGLDLHARRSDGSLFPVEIALSPVELDGVHMTIAAIRDVSAGRETMARLTLLKERERIARDLHDMVIQRIFAAGMSLQSLISLVDSPDVRDRINDVTDSLDETIFQLRQSIFELGNLDERQTLSSQIAAIIDEGSAHLGFVPELHVEGSLDRLPPLVADQLIATVTESMSNVARHAGATSARVAIESTDGKVSLVVEDDGVGVDVAPKVRGGLSNLMWRAAELGGSCSIAPNTPTGTRLVWEVPTGPAGSSQ